jgi:hypothetical protein
VSAHTYTVLVVCCIAAIVIIMAVGIITDGVR